MKKIKKQAFWTVIVLTISIFFTDKIFLIPPIKKISLYYKKVEVFFYESRYFLFQYLKSHHQNQNFALILGSSRSGMFSNQDIQKFFSYPVFVYNFSAPLAGTSFYYYWLKKILQEIPKKPKFIIMELDALNLGEPSIYISIPYSYDPIFMLTYMDFYRNFSDRIPSQKLDLFLSLLFRNQIQSRGFSANEVDSYFIKYFFITARYNIHPRKIWENFKTIRYYDPDSHKTEIIPLYEFAYRMKLKNLENFKKTLGGIPAEFYTQIPARNLKQDAEKSFLRFLPEPVLSSTQIIFLKKIIELTKKYRIPIIIYKPPMSIYANEILKRYHLYQLPSMIQYIKKYPYTLYVDASHLSCQQFSDAVHLKPGCYRVLTHLILQKIFKRFPIF